MQYYVWMDSEDNPVVRLKSYIDNEDPGFWTRNWSPSIVVWTVDGDDRQSVRALLELFEKRQTPTRIVRDVCSAVGFDLPAYLASLTKKPTRG